MKIVALVMCNSWIYNGGLKTINSLKYFHPEIDVVIYGDKEIDSLKKKYNIDDSLWMSGPCLMMDYLDSNPAPDLLVKIGADCLVLGKLDEIINQNYDVASPRNDSDQVVGDERLNRPDIIRDIPNHEWVNADLICVKNMDFIKKYYEKVMDYNEGRELALKDFGKIYKGDDMSGLNVVFRLGGFKSVILDPKGSNIVYGASGNWCDRSRYRLSDGTVNNWSSWKDIYFDGQNCIMPDGGRGTGSRIVKILHQSGGLYKDKLNFDLFNNEFRKYLTKITNFDK